MKKETIVFGGGCFWCTEAVFKMLKGVRSVKPGYSGGELENPTYEQVSTGNTGYVEVVEINFDPEEIFLSQLLTVFFASHDPTALNRQGEDVGEQYRSVIFYTTSSQKEESEKFIKNLNLSSDQGDEIVTTVEPLKNFYIAENYHFDYYGRNKNQPYCTLVINPNLEKVKKDFSKLLKNDQEK